jgi:SAM-dependent methyltransferase
MTSCPYCDGDLSDAGVRLDLRMGTCQSCGSLACIDEVTEDQLASLYGDPGYYSGSCPPYGYDGDFERNDAQRRPVWEQRLRAMGDITPGRRLLELGPGQGGFLRFARGEGWDVAAVDPYPAADLQVVPYANLLEAAREGPFDAVCLFDVLEHVLQPRQLLGDLPSVMAPGGCAAVGMPNLDGPSYRRLGLQWCEVKPPEHLSLPTVTGMRIAVAGAGLTVVGVIGHFAETWLWERMRSHLDHRRSVGVVGSGKVLGARVVNRGAREVRLRLGIPAPQHQDYVTWLLARAGDG